MHTSHVALGPTCTAYLFLPLSLRHTLFTCFPFVFVAPLLFFRRGWRIACPSSPPLYLFRPPRLPAHMQTHRHRSAATTPHTIQCRHAGNWRGDVLWCWNQQGGSAGDVLRPMRCGAGTGKGFASADGDGGGRRRWWPRISCCFFEFLLEPTLILLPAFNFAATEEDIVLGGDGGGRHEAAFDLFFLEPACVFLLHLNFLLEPAIDFFGTSFSFRCNMRG